MVFPRSVLPLLPHEPLRPEQGGCGLGVVDPPVRRHVQRLGKGQLEGLQKLVLIQVAVPKGEIPGQEQVKHLVSVSHAGHDVAQGVPPGGLRADLLLQLPLDGLKGILPRLQLPGGDLHHHLAVGVAELALQIDVPLPVQGGHRRAAGVVDHLPDGGAAVGQLHLIPVELQQDAVKGQLAGQGFFR